MECANKGFFFQEQIDFPSEERMKKKAVAIIECCQEIPCNPCVDACPVGAISIAHNINAPPVIDFEKCTGCGLCLGFCPGLAIFLVDLSKGKARVTIPYELFPPEKGETVELLNRSGDVIGKGTVERVILLKKHDRTLTVTLVVDEDQIREVRGFRRKNE
jgi:Fe-S-cluster-containing hydrogenase component 2